MAPSLHHFPLISFSSSFFAGKFQSFCYFNFLSFCPSRHSFFLPAHSNVLGPLNWGSRMTTLSRGSWAELLLMGLNFSAKRLKYYRPPFMVDLHKSHRIICAQPRLSPLVARVFKRRLLFFSFSSQYVHSLLAKIQHHRPANRYSGHGAVTRDTGLRLKPGKIRQKS